jgi:hypothetical protein
MSAALAAALASGAFDGKTRDFRQRPTPKVRLGAFALSRRQTRARRTPGSRTRPPGGGGSSGSGERFRPRRARGSERTRLTASAAPSEVQILDVLRRAAS